MRCITYAGGRILTTDDVAEALVTLTAAAANSGTSVAVTIPIVSENTNETAEAELVIGVGNDVLSAPTEWGRATPDFTAQAAELRSHQLYPAPHREEADETHPPISDHADLDFDLYSDL